VARRVVVDLGSPAAIRRLVDYGRFTYADGGGVVEGLAPALGLAPDALERFSMPPEDASPVAADMYRSVASRRVLLARMGLAHTLRSTSSLAEARACTIINGTSDVVAAMDAHAGHADLTRVRFDTPWSLARLYTRAHAAHAALVEAAGGGGGDALSPHLQRRLAAVHSWLYGPVATVFDLRVVTEMQARFCAQLRGEFMQ
jgi:hypothetical protein